MRRVIGVLVLLFVGVLASPSRVTGADTVRTFSPPTTKIDLSRFEPGGSATKIPDLPEEAYMKGNGILSQDFDHPFGQRGVYWDVAPFALVFPQSDGQGWKFTINPAGIPLLRACGYQSSTAPKATLTYPDGHQDSLTGTQPDSSPGCWDYAVNGSMGMTFGIYSLTLEHPAGRLTRSWGVDYPLCRTVQGVRSSENSIQLVLMGYAPNEKISMEIYTGSGKDRRHVATRSNIQAGPDGAVAVTVNVADKAPFKLDDLQYLIPTISRYPIPATIGGWPFYQNSENPGFEGSCTGHYYVGDVNRLRPQQANQPLYAAFGDTSKTAGKLPSGNLDAQVLDEKPAVQDGRVVVWEDLKLSNGSEGWLLQGYPASAATTKGSALVTSLFGGGESCPGALPSRLVIGGQGIVLPSGPNRVRSEPAGAVLGKIPEGETFNVMAGPRCTSNHIAWWKVAYKGLTGWTPEGQGLDYWLEPTQDQNG